MCENKTTVGNRGRRMLTAAFWLACAIPVVFIGALALEMFLRARVAEIQSAPKYEKNRTLATKIHPELTVLPPALSWAEFAPHPPRAASWEIPRAEESPAQRQARIALLPSLTPEERYRLAMAHGLAILDCTASGHVNAIHANDKLRSLMLRGVASRSQLDSGAGYTWAARWDLAEFLDKPWHDREYDLVTVPCSVADQVQAARDTGQVQVQRFESNPAEYPEFAFDAYVVASESGEDVFVALDLGRWYHLGTQFRVQRTWQDFDLDERWIIHDFQYKPNRHFSDALVTNRFGYRGADPVVPKPSGVFRIVCIGGSTTYDGDWDNTSYPAFLEQELRAAFPGHPIEVINAGVQGLRTRSQLLHLPNFLEMQPDLVIGYLGVNDLIHDIEKPVAFPVSAEGPPSVFKELSRCVARRNAWFFDASVADYYRDQFQQLTINNVESLRRIFAAQGIRFALASIATPNEERVSREVSDYIEFRSGWAADFHARASRVLNDVLRAYCARERLLYIPFDENFEQYELMTDWCHINDEGNRVKARVFALALHDFVAGALGARNAVQTSAATD